MENYLVSIVVPVYNVEQYIERCVNSILKQTYKNIEIILVDDGSKDSSGKICNEYKEKDSRIIVIHQQNQGLSAARNTGIKIAKGKYITFIDSDDVVADFYIEVLLNACIKNNAQIAIGEYKQFSTESINFTKENNPEIIEYTPFNAEKGLITTEIVNAACIKIYEKRLFEGVQFPVGYIYEDLGTTYKLLYKAEKIVKVKQIIYGYYYRPDSLAHSEFSVKNLDFLPLAKERAEFFKDKNEELYILFLDQYVNRIENYYPLTLHKLKMKDEAKKMLKEFYKYLGTILKSKYIPLRHKLNFLSVAIIPFGFEFRLMHTERKEKNGK